MRLDDLPNGVVPQLLVNRWKERQGEQLLPVQAEAIRRGLLSVDRSGEPSRNMLISAPTSSGKTFCAELAAAAALAQRKRVILVYPLKALAEEAHRNLSRWYRELGLDCLIVTGDHPENDAALAAGRYHIAVTIIEKLDLLMCRRMPALQNVGLVVVDEIQMLGEPGRGAVLERMLTKLLLSPSAPRLIALSAVLSEQSAERLARWLHADVVTTHSRPRDLIRGVAANGRLRFRSYNDGLIGSESFEEIDPSATDSDHQLVHHLARVKGPTLVFVKSRSDSIGLALKLAAETKWPAASKAMEALNFGEESYLTRSLRQALSKGVAFHNADLPSESRNIVEQAFRNKEVKVLISTTTLSLGVNLPAETVYLETVKYVSERPNVPPVLMPVSRAEFDNMSGRAGRFVSQSGRPAEPGRAIVLTGSEFDQEVIWESYISHGDLPALESSFDDLPLEDWVLHLVVCGLADSADSLMVALAGTFKGQAEKVRGEDLERALQALIETGLLDHRRFGGGIEATAQGRAVAHTGLQVCEAAHYARLLEETHPESPLGWLALALSSIYWPLPPSMITRWELVNNMVVRMLYERCNHAIEEAWCLLPEDHRSRPLGYREAASVKALLLLADWIELTPVVRLEERYRLHLGQIQHLASTAAHLITGIGATIAAQAPQSPVAALLADLAFSLRLGIPAELQSLHEQAGQVLSRADYQTLKNHDVTTFEALLECEEADLSKWFKKDKNKQISELLERYKQEVDMHSPEVSISQQMINEMQSLEIDGAPDRDRFMVRINGQPVPLTGKSFKYLTKLAWSRLNGDSGWLFKEDIEVGFNQARYLYRMKNEIRSLIGLNSPLVENNRLGYYRLKVAPQKIHLNAARLKEHPDFEIRSLFALGESQRMAS